MAERLNARTVLNARARPPGYVPEKHGAGIVHLGLGAFHRAHQAVATDDALAAEGGDWRIVGSSLRSAGEADALTAQDGRYTLIVRGAGGTSARVIGAVAQAIAGARDKAALKAALAAPHTRIVSLTVTEKGYGIDRASGGADRSHPAVAADLATPDDPVGVLGHIVAALKARRAAGLAPFTVLSCDNLPGNGEVVRGAVIDFAAAVDPALADHIARSVAFPSTMVDRITPARTETTLRDAEAMTGARDEAAIETEPFTQWVIEDRFPEGRPAWEAGGALFVDHVAPYEAMKLAMLNGTHSLLAYTGVVAEHPYVRDAMANPALRALARRHLAAAAATLDPVPGIDLAVYADDLVERFDNPHLAHQTYQIAMDGTEKLPQRILGPAERALSRGEPLRPYAFALAAWMRYALGRTDSGETYALRDPREAEIEAAVAAGGTPSDLAGRLMRLGPLRREALLASEPFVSAVEEIFAAMVTGTMAAAIRAEAG